MRKSLSIARTALDDFRFFSGYVVRRFWKDNCLMGAAALSYTTLLSFVPLIAVALAFFSGFPSFTAARDRLLNLIFTHLAPEVGDEAAWWFNWFAQSAARTTAVGVITLGFSAILLLATIEDQLQMIWRVSTARHWLQRVLVYWALLTFGPILLGASLSLSGYFDTAARSVGFDAESVERAVEVWFHGLSRAMPFVLETVALTLLYYLVPNTRVRWREAVSGGLVAAGAVELLKIGFEIYVNQYSSYRNVYGALAAIPIFLFWMYISWGGVLLGAVVAAALPQWRVEGQPGVPTAGRHLGVSLAILGTLAECSRVGGRLSTKQLADMLGLSTGAVEEHLGPLHEARFITPTADNHWVLSRSPEHATLFDLYEALGLPLAGQWREGGGEAKWQKRVAEVMERVCASEATALRIPLASVLAEMPTSPEKPTRLRPFRRSG